MKENPVQEIPSSEEPQLKRFFSLGTENTKWVLLFLLIFLSLAGGLFLNLRGNSTNKISPKTEDKNNTKIEFIAPQSLVYGYWTKGNSVIAVLDLSTSQNSILAQLPTNVKHVKILDSKRIIYIKDTDESDYGKEIVTRNLETKTETTIVKADDTFGIDDYVVSPNIRYLAVWEVSPPEGSTQLFGGKSRVYTVDTQKPLQKNLIYDETSGLGITLAYPIAITDRGELFTDRFLPNSGAGWGYGMSVSNFSGTNKQDIASLANGMISTQPIASEDGSKLLFAGYDGRKGQGTVEIDGFRRAILSSNTIEIFDLNTKQKKILLSAEADDIFPNAKWDLLTRNIIYSQVSKDNSRSGNYIYNLATNTSRKINLDNNFLSTFEQESPIVKNIIAAISDNSFLVSDEVVSDSALGNLGSKYNQSINSIYIFDTTSQTKKTINLGAGLTQFIDLKPEKYFSFLNSSDNSLSASDRNKNQLQLQSFDLKPSLAPQREKQQTKPVPKLTCQGYYPGYPYPIPPECSLCEDAAKEQCNALIGKKDFNNNAAWYACYNKTLSAIRQSGACYDSPLYLYGQEGQRTTVYVGTSIFSPNANYSPASGFSVILGLSGDFSANGKTVSSLEFQYTPAIKIVKPKQGYVVPKNAVVKTMQEISEALGLNEKETEDTLNFIKEKIISPYVFISLFDDKTSKKILPLIISPTPDTYRNIVFYIENLDENPNISYKDPPVGEIVRKGFTAIEISFIVK